MSLLEDVYFAGGVVSLEDINAGQTPNKEVEYEIYGRVRDLGELQKAAKKELQEQWGLHVDKTADNAATGGVRVRCIDDEKYILTSKVKINGGNEEEEVETTPGMFIHFKKLADKGLRKMRFFFPVEGTDFTYEVDAFYNSAGQFVPWVKIDLELPAGSESLDALPELPFEMDDVVVVPPGKKSEEHLAFCRSLFKEHFDMPNQFVDRHAPAMEQVYQCNLFEPDIERAARDLASRARGLMPVLSYNGEGLEARLKHSLFELATDIENFYDGHTDEGKEFRALADAGKLYVPETD